MDVCSFPFHQNVTIICDFCSSSLLHHKCLAQKAGRTCSGSELIGETLTSRCSWLTGNNETGGWMNENRPETHARSSVRRGKHVGSVELSGNGKHPGSPGETSKIKNLRARDKLQPRQNRNRCGRWRKGAENQVPEEKTDSWTVWTKTRCWSWVHLHPAATCGAELKVMTSTGNDIISLKGGESADDQKEAASVHRAKCIPKFLQKTCIRLLFVCFFTKPGTSADK